MDNTTILAKATLLSPLSVGDGNTLSPLADYYVADGRLYRIAPQKLEAYLAENNLLSRYIKAVRRATNVAKDDFWADTLEMDDLGDLSNGRSYRFYPTNNPTEVKTMLRNGLNPYVPGSSVKGAIKTALLYDWLLQHDKKELQSILAHLKTYTRDTRQWRDADREIERHLNFLLQPKGSEHAPPDFHLLRIGDSSLLDDAKTEVILTKRLHLLKGIFDIPVAREAIRASVTTCMIPLTLSPGWQHPYLKQVAKEGWEGIFKRVNQFSRAHIGWMLDELEASADSIHDNGPADLYGVLTTWLDDRYNALKNAPANTCYLQVGAGKSYFANSIGLTLYDHSQEVYQQWRRLFKLGKERQQYFPVTLNLDSERFLPLGWVKLDI